MGDARELRKIRNTKGIYYFNGGWTPFKKEWIAKRMTKESKFVNNIIKKFRRTDEEGILKI